MSTSRRRRLFAALVVPATLLLLGSTAQATTFSPEVDPVAAINADIAQHNHELGSQIRRVEGDKSTPDSQKAAQQRPAGQAIPGQVLATVAGMDGAGYQGNVDWGDWWNQGKRFGWTRRGESTTAPQP